MTTSAKKETLEFKPVVLQFQKAYITGTGVGEYKVIKYGKYWYAYIHESWQSNWGNSCEHEYGKSKEFNTRFEAQESAQKHYNVL